uniref:Uncharacterized protein n=1 Tax=viral metagenome TaxID=1070528 RepID=A0A6C0B362_9ZZZZ
MSKSIFLSQSTDSKSVFSPVIGAGDLSLLDSVNYNYLNTLDDYYATPADNQLIPYITQDIVIYNLLYAELNNILSKATDYRFIKLMKLILALFHGVYLSTFMYGNTVSLGIQNSNLRIQLQDVLANKNVKNIDTVGGTGQMSITKNFKLAPVYNHYITVFGMPENGKGFDPVKLSYLANILLLNNINPYR